MRRGRFGVALESLVVRERGAGNVPVVVRRCAEEVERRGLDCVGIYRLCCSSRRRRLLKADIDSDADAAVLTADRVPDVNVVSCEWPPTLRYDVLINVRSKADVISQLNLPHGTSN